MSLLELIPLTLDSYNGSKLVQKSKYTNSIFYKEKFIEGVKVSIQVNKDYQLYLRINDNYKMVDLCKETRKKISIWIQKQIEILHIIFSGRTIWAELVANDGFYDKRKDLFERVGFKKKVSNLRTTDYFSDDTQFELFLYDPRNQNLDSNLVINFPQFDTDLTKELFKVLFLESIEVLLEHLLKIKLPIQEFKYFWFYNPKENSKDRVEIKTRNIFNSKENNYQIDIFNNWELKELQLN
jgi:hypothetical protein